MSGLLINIDNNAKGPLEKLLKEHVEYEYIRFSLTSGCSPKVEISLDNYVEGDVIQNFENFLFCYNNNLELYLKEIYLNYNNGFLLKAVPINSTPLTSCKSNCSGCSGKENSCNSSCSSCSKK